MRPADLTVTTHVCRGNFRFSWIAEGGYEPIAEVSLGQTDYDGYFLNTTARAPADSNRCASCPPAAKESCLAW